MNLYRSRCWILALVLGISTSGYGQEIGNPLEDFLRNREIREDDEVLRMEADIDGDRLPEVFVTLSRYDNARAGYSWTAYLPVGRGFVRSDDIVSFRIDAIYASWIPELDGYAMLTYLPGGVSGGALVAIRKQGEAGLSETRMKMLSFDDPSDVDLYGKYFGRPQVPKVDRYSVSDIRSLGGYRSRRLQRWIRLQAQW